MRSRERTKRYVLGRKHEDWLGDSRSPEGSIVRATDIYVPPQRIGFGRLGARDSARASYLAGAALAAFGLEGYSIAAVIKHSNVVVRLVSPSGPALALRLRIAPAVDARTEFEWLSAVRRGTGLRVVEPFAEEFVENTRVVVDRDGTLVECSLFYWADGTPLAAHLSTENYKELGRMTAELHDFACGWSAPPGLKPLVWNRTLYYEGTELVVSNSRFRSFVSRQEASAVETIMARADEELRSLALASDRIFLHGNIEMWNVLTTGPGELRLLDFEDVMLGTPVQDVAITLFYGSERSDYDRLIRAYQEGYCGRREWPVRDGRQMDLLVAARATMLLNYALETEAKKKLVTDRLLPLILAAA